MLEVMQLMSIDSNPTKYRMYINFDNDKLVYVVPVLPEKIKVSVKGKTTSVSIDRFGEAVHKGKRDSIVISFSSFFPAVYGRNYCSCRPEEFKEPKKWHKLDAEEGRAFKTLSFCPGRWAIIAEHVCIHYIIFRNRIWW